MADFKVVTSDFVKLHISTSKDDISFDEKRFAKSLSISDFKAKLELITGGNCNTMKLEAYDKDNKHVCSLGDNNALLGSYPLDDGTRIHVIDKFEATSQFEYGDVEKFEVTDEEYAKKDDTVRAFLLKNKLGQYNEENIKKKEKLEAEEKELAESTPIGSRCKVTTANGTKLGTVMYSGKVETLPGFWIGIKYDEPLGKHNGTFKGKQYFNCPDNYGSFVKPANVECGDFPEDDYDLNEEI